ncbi:hypothetical protein Tco_0113106, partial [Tanacetum coccineum]
GRRSVVANVMSVVEGWTDGVRLKNGCGNAYAIALYHTVSSEASSDKSGSRERFADAVFGVVVAVDELFGVWSR